MITYTCDKCKTRFGCVLPKLVMKWNEGSPSVNYEEYHICKSCIEKLFFDLKQVVEKE